MANEQMKLVDVGPENLSEIAPHVKRYRQAVKERLTALQIECKEKEEIKQLVKSAKLSRLPNGSIKFSCEGMLVVIEPRDEVIHVTDDKPKKKRGRPKNVAPSSMADAGAKGEAEHDKAGPKNQKHQRKVKDLVK